MKPRSGQTGGGPAWGPHRTTTSQTHGDHERLHGHKVPAHAEASAQRPTNSSCADPRALPGGAVARRRGLNPRGARRRSGIPEAHHGDNKFRCRTLRAARRNGAGERDRWRGSSLIGCTDGSPSGYPSDSSCGQWRAGRRALSTTQDRFSFILDRTLVSGETIRACARDPTTTTTTPPIAYVTSVISPSRCGTGRGTRAGGKTAPPRSESPWYGPRTVGVSGAAAKANSTVRVTVG